MKRITQSHNPAFWIYAFSNLLERAGYYGFRAILVLYVFETLPQIEHEDILSTIGILSSVLVFTPIIGGLIGDFVLNYKKSIVLGCILQAIGIVLIYLYSSTLVFVGLGIIVLGASLYKPNLSAQVGKMYLSKTDLLDAAFTFIYLFVNIGAFIGILALGLLAESVDYSYGFAAAALMMLASGLITLLHNEVPESQQNEVNTTGNINYKIIISAIVLLAIYWGLNELASVKKFLVMSNFEELYMDSMPKSIWQGIDFYFLAPMSIVLGILWSKFFYRRLLKFLTGFLFAALSFFVLYLIPESTQEAHLPYYITALALFAVSEIIITPLLNSIVIQYTNKAYLSTTLAVAMIPAFLFTQLIYILSVQNLMDTTPLVLTTAIISTIVVVILGAFYLNQSNQNQEIL